MNYIESVRAAIERESPGLEPELLDLYTLLALARGMAVTQEDVHNAWAVWRSRSNPFHRSIIPFDELEADVQALDELYRLAVSQAAFEHPYTCGPGHPV